MKLRSLFVSIFFIVLFACSREESKPVFKIIPEPRELSILKGSIYLTDTIGKIYTKVKEGFIPEGGPEAYELTMGKEAITITGNSEAGVFYGLKTLDQILPPGGLQGGDMEISQLKIRDWPAFEWRGGMLDVSRHFFPKEFILKYIDILAFHKLNHFHWHLTDGTAWRLEIDKYPELTQNVDSYSKEDVREIVEYAKERFITIIPEIEMPGHSEAALQIMPHLKCDPDVKSGVYCAGKDEVFDFLEIVLTEVIDLFPSDLIHIGGDEVGKGHWQTCPDCQARIKKESLANEEELQSYFIKRISAFLESKGKILIGWDEIMEGGLPVNAKVMSWRGMKGGIEASNMGHDVVMSPGYPCYFDHYQSAHDNEPQAWGGLNGIKDVYGFNPVPDEIDSSLAHHVLGGQANLWTEQISTPHHAEYMLMPRYSALSEALWSGSENSNWEWFEQKMLLQIDRYEALGYNYSKSSFSPALDLIYNSDKGDIQISAHRELNLFNLHYSLNGQEPGPEFPIYSGPVSIEPGQVFKAQTFRKGKKFGFQSKVDDLPNLATGKKVRYFTDWEKAYSASGELSLTDAQLASKRGDHKNWQGFMKKNIDVIVDLEKQEVISGVWMRFFQHAGMTRVLLPLNLTISASNDGENFSIIGHQDIIPVSSSEAIIKKIIIKIPEMEYRYMRFQAENPMELFKGHHWYGMDAWIFSDELGIH